MFRGIPNYRVVNHQLVSIDDGGTQKVLAALDSFELLKIWNLSEFSIFHEYCELQLRLTDSIENGYELKCRLLVGSEMREISALSEINDYFIDDSIWAPVAIGAIEDVESLMAACGCDNFGKITAKQYLYFSVHGRALTPPIVVDAIDESHLSPSKLENSCVLTATPYQYQQQGFEWLSWLRAAGLGGLLGDEMGLGKTLQVIMLLQAEIAKGHSPNLVICPPSLLENWRREIKRFINIEAYIHQGEYRHFEVSKIAAHSIVVASYDSVRRDSEYLQKVEWNIIAADEAQYIKNNFSQRTIAVKKLPKMMGIAVSGTPIENSLTDLWSLIDFAIPNFLGDYDWFTENFLSNTISTRELKGLIRPLVLRRRVLEVADDLPELTIKPQAIPMPETMARQYCLADSTDSSTIVSAFKKLSYQRKICNHISISDEVDFFSTEQGKIEYMRDSLQEIDALKNKALLFAPYTRTIQELTRWYRNSFPNSFVEVINGVTPINRRQAIVDEFSEFNGSGLLIMNPKAAGVGLNMTAANHVFHFSPDWNPAVIDQASARSYRRGQTLPVTIHNLFYEGSVEEYMNSRLESKRNLSEETLDETRMAPTLDELNEALKMRPTV
jgi:SNF2 family DNA or RNA helicase